MPVSLAKTLRQSGLRIESSSGQRNNLGKGKAVFELTFDSCSTKSLVQHLKHTSRLASTLHIGAFMKCKAFDSFKIDFSTHTGCRTLPPLGIVPLNMHAATSNPVMVDSVWSLLPRHHLRAKTGSQHTSPHDPCRKHSTCILDDPHTFRIWSYL